MVCCWPSARRSRHASAGHSRWTRARIAAGSPNDWLTYHGAYNGWNYSGLDQINPSNVKDLAVAWIHVPGRSTRGLQSVPLVADGVLYYTGSYSRVFALDGATGAVIWSYFPELDDMLVARQTHSPYNRGVALGQGKVFVGTVDGRLIALDMKTGKVAWDTKLQDSQKLTVGFTGAPLYAKGMVVIGSQGGEWPGRGPIYGVDAETGKVKWTFLTVAPTDDEKKTWGNDSWRTGGGGGWMPGTYDSEHQHALLGNRQPGAAVRLVGRRLEDRRARARATTSTPRRCSVSISIPASSSSIIRNCRMMPGTSTARWASS